MTQRHWWNMYTLEKYQSRKRGVWEQRKKRYLFIIFLPTKVIAPCKTGFLIFCLKLKLIKPKTVTLTSYVGNKRKHDYAKMVTSIVVRLAPTNVMCIIRKPSTLTANAKFKTEKLGWELSKIMTSDEMEETSNPWKLTKCDESSCKFSWC